MRNAALFFLSLLLTAHASAAQISFTGVSVPNEVEIRLDTQGERVNAIRGEILFASETAEFRSWHDGNSIVNLWVQKPHVEGNTISFEGVIPGGFEGSNGLLLTLQFQGTGDAALALSEESRAFLNDGEGTQTNLSAAPFTFAIRYLPAGGNADVKEDTDPPEPFTAYITQDSNVFDGRKMLIFSTQDKKSGVARYEVRETPQTGVWRFALWREAESPYTLRDQALESIIEIRAIDHAGNKRKIVVRPLSGAQGTRPAYPLLAGIVALILIAVWFQFLKKRS